MLLSRSGPGGSPPVGGSAAQELKISGTVLSVGHGHLRVVVESDKSSAEMQALVAEGETPALKHLLSAFPELLQALENLCPNVRIAVQSNTSSAAMPALMQALMGTGECSGNWQLPKHLSLSRINCRFWAKTLRHRRACAQRYPVRANR